MREMLHKVIAIPRNKEAPGEVLVLRHPDGGFQLIGGSVEEMEDPLEAAMRECFEESGIVLAEANIIWSEETRLPEGQAYLLTPANPMFDNALKRGHLVSIVRESGGIAFVKEMHLDFTFTPPIPKREYEGSVSSIALSRGLRRSCVVGTAEKHADSWECHSDGMSFLLMWMEIGYALTVLTGSHREWLRKSLFSKNYFPSE